MQIRFKTNLDLYSGYDFPCFKTHQGTYGDSGDLTISVPRKGEMVEVIPAKQQHFNDLKLPARLEVVDVTYTSREIIVELWYNSTDLKLAWACGAKPMG